MRATILTLCAAAIVAAGASGARADDKSHKKAAEDLLKVMQVEQQLDTSIAQSLDMQMKANPALATKRPAMEKFFKKHMSYASLKPDLVKMYADAFTEQELNQIRDFYLTPAGQKMVEKSPELMVKGMQIGAKRVQDNMGELQQMLSGGGGSVKQ